MGNQTMNAGLDMQESITQLTTELLRTGDVDHARKLEQLAEKVQAKMLGIAFCGHFSAGKSTLINQLCGHALLPSSPIPTSANIVSIRNGEAGAEVTHKENAEGKVVRSQIALEELEAYCVNGSDIETVEIRYPIPLLGDHGVLLDTPGIDSTDDAHHQSTESALHLADVVFYVMDYNHVQSEINLAFTKKMKEWGKPLYLIVNMIDKHKERELPFSEYREGTLQAFRSWGIEPDGILYLTMKEPEHPHNEWGKLTWLLDQLLERSESLRLYSVDASAHHLLGEHGKWTQEQNEPVKAELREKLEQDNELEAVQVLADKKQGELTALERAAEELQLQLRKDLTGIIENANITPALTRDRADLYLQSRKPGFKLGFFGRAAQTAAEAEKRLLAFQEDLAEQVKAQLDWYLRDALKKAAVREGLLTEPLAAEIEALGVVVAAAWLAEHVNTGAVFGGEYTLNYMKQVAGDIKQQYRKQAFAVIDLLAAAQREQSTQAAAALAEELAALAERLSAYRELQRLEQTESAAQQALLQKAAWRKVLPPALPALQQYVSLEGAPLAPQSGGLRVTSMGTILAAASTAATGASPAVPEAAGGAPSVFASGEHGKRMERKAAALQTAADLIEAMPPMRSLARSMREKAERLQKRTFTIALFGAFSAGKSSFANALIGERVLPVSPNPTTAAINRIVPPQEGWPHGTARVKMKAADTILQDVLYSLELLGVQAVDMPSALSRIAALSPDQVSAKGKPHYSFLKAVEKGWSQAASELGSDLRITKEEFPDYVAEEAKSCFVEFIELFYSNPLTDQGIIFVDTPGADSINARHTGVAFNYIKNADAILFVTYYNHAFSHADREFLLQLGRVKDSFEMDKMFFIVNAADLASSKEELEGVVKHVETNLVQHGIRHPRIYPISSYLAAEGKINQDSALVAGSGIVPFEEDFVKFTFDELSEIAIHAADLELNRGIHTLQQWIEGAQEGEAQRKVRVEQLVISQQQAHHHLKQSEISAERKELSKEIHELLYYVKQRSTYRFGELYNLAFNPSNFREDLRDPKQALQASWQELLRMIGFDLSQEVLATTLRVENRMNRLAQDKFLEWERQLGSIAPGFESGAYESLTFVTPEIEAKLTVQDVTEKQLYSLFKNAKHFFEGEGKLKLRGELESKLIQPISDLMELQAQALEAAYLDQLDTWLEELKQNLETNLDEHIGGLMDALQMKVDIDELIGKREQLQSLL
jgi:GTPase Era involved in 16S rRNA processing